MFDNIKPGYQVERFVCEWQSFGRTFANVGQAARATEIERFTRNVYTFRLSEFRKRLEISARAAANVENARLALAFRAKFVANALHKRGDDATPADVPPMRVLDLTHNRVSVGLHFSGQRLTHQSMIRSFQSLASYSGCASQSRRPARQLLATMTRTLRARCRNWSAPREDGRQS